MYSPCGRLTNIPVFWSITYWEFIFLDWADTLKLFRFIIGLLIDKVLLLFTVLTGRKLPGGGLPVHSHEPYVQVLPFLLQTCSITALLHLSFVSWLVDVPTQSL